MCSITGRTPDMLSAKCKPAGQYVRYNFIYTKSKKHVYVYKCVRKRSGNDNSGCLWGRKLEREEVEKQRLFFSFYSGILLEFFYTSAFTYFFKHIFYIYIL